MGKISDLPRQTAPPRITGNERVRCRVVLAPHKQIDPTGSVRPRGVGYDSRSSSSKPTDQGREQFLRESEQVNQSSKQASQPRQAKHNNKPRKKKKQQKRSKLSDRPNY